MRKLLRRRANQSEIDADIEEYLAEKTEALIASGLSAEEARYQARRDFGNVTLLKELSADEWSWGGIEQVMNDFKYACRSLLRNPAFSLTAIFTLALGVGANAAIFNLLHAVILRTLPVPDAEQLRLFNVVGPQKDLESIFSYPVLRQMQDSVAGKAEIAAFSGISPMKAGESEQVQAELVSGNYFQALRVQPEAGHLLTQNDDKMTGAYPAVLSDAYWSKRYGRDRSIIGQSVNINDTPVTIAGVAAHNFFGLEPGSRPDFWLPVSAQFDLRFKSAMSGIVMVIRAKHFCRSHRFDGCLSLRVFQTRVWHHKWQPASIKFMRLICGAKSRAGRMIRWGRALCWNLDCISMREIRG